MAVALINIPKVPVSDLGQKTGLSVLFHFPWTVNQNGEKVSVQG
jgi:hypothetical protein